MLLDAYETCRYDTRLLFIVHCSMQTWYVIIILLRFRLRHVMSARELAER